MNKRILTYLLENLADSFKLERWADIRVALNADTVVDQLPWTPKRLEKFVEDIDTTFDVDASRDGDIIFLKFDSANIHDIRCND